MKKLTEPQRRLLRVHEIQNKVNVLRGRAGERYKRARDAAASGKEGQGADSAEGTELREAGEVGGEDLDEDEEGEGPARWAFERTSAVGSSRNSSSGDAVVSDEARAVAATELAGARNASARQLMDAACEFQYAGLFKEATELLELARPRIDQEQIQRKIDLSTAQQLDDECVWQLADAYDQSGRLTLACDRYGELKNRMVDRKERGLAESKWAQVAFRLSERLSGAQRFEDGLQLLEAIKEQTTRASVGDVLWEEVDMYAAMALQSLGRTAEAKQRLAQVTSTTASRKRQAQALFVLDVISVDTEGQRNEEFHALWDESFQLPKDSFSSPSMPMGTSRRAVNLNLRESEREFRMWASEYWDERMKSPLYYAFLTLWVTWPFAIPVVAVLSKVPP